MDSARSLTIWIQNSRSISPRLAKVNASFSEYFALMFGGGGARLTLEEPEEPEPTDDESSFAEATEDSEDLLEERSVQG